MPQTTPNEIKPPAPKLGKRAISRKMRELQAKRKTHAAGPGVAKKAPPSKTIGPWDDRHSHACQLRIAGASLQYIGDVLQVSRERARQLINESETRHPKLYKRVQVVIAKENDKKAA